jgi:hypothetical protein
MKRYKYSEMEGLPGFIPSHKSDTTKGGFTGKESDFQSLCEQYLEIKNLLYLHIPAKLLESLFRSPVVPVWIKRAVKQYIAHWPDIIIFRDGRYLAIELKTATGELTHGQKDRLADMGGMVIRDFEDFKKTVDQWEEKHEIVPRL